MKIALIGQKGIPALKGGGVEKHVELLAVRLAELGHEVYVYTRPSYTDKNLSSYKGVNLISLPSLHSKNLDAISHTFLACLDLIFKRQVDIVHFHSIGPSSLLWLVKLFKPKTPIVATFHSQCYLNDKWGLFARTYLQLGERMLCERADKTIVVSKNLDNYVSYKYLKSDHIYLPNGVNLPEKLMADRIQKNWGLNPNEYILSVSRLDGIKGLEFLINAFKNIQTDKKLVIVGDGEIAANLKALAKDDNRIIFTGFQSDNELVELFSNAKLFVQSSKSEGLSIALLEAMSYGLPVLVSDIEQNLTATDNQGFRFKTENTEDLQEKLEAILAMDEQFLKAEGDKLLAIVRAKYDWTEIADQIVNVYQELLKA